MTFWSTVIITGWSHFGFMDGVVVRYSDVSRERTASIFEVTELVHVYAAVIWKKTSDACTKRSGGHRPNAGSDGGEEEIWLSTIYGSVVHNTYSLLWQCVMPEPVRGHCCLICTQVTLALNHALCWCKLRSMHIQRNCPWRAIRIIMYETEGLCMGTVVRNVNCSAVLSPMFTTTVYTGNLKECHPRCVYHNYSRSMIKE